MSGGHWNYRQDKLRWLSTEVTMEITPTEAIKLLNIMGELIKMVDWDICGDTSRKDTETRLYDYLEEEVEKLWSDYI